METSMVDIQQIQQKSVARNILKTGIPPKTELSSWEGKKRQQNKNRFHRN